MFKKITIIPVITVLLLASCSPAIDKEEEVVQNNEDDDEKTSIVSSELSDEDYQTILPYRPSASRGVITNQMGNRLDIDEVEMGLRRLSKDYYDPEKYLFEEGQYLTSDMLYNWLDRYPADADIDDMGDTGLSGDKQALNLPIKEDATVEERKESPKYLSHILEQDYLERKDDDTVKLAGISIGIALKSVDRFKINGERGKVKISKSKMLEKGKEIASSVLKRVRNMDELKNKPVMIALYREEDESSPVAGSYTAKTSVAHDENKIDDWEKVSEENVLFPSDKGEEKHYDTQQLVKNFEDRIEKYFPNYIGVIGKGFFIDDELQKLKLNIPIEFHSKGEVVGFTQYTTNLVDEMFEKYYELEIKISSAETVESIIYQEAGSSESQVHIFDG